MRLAVLYYIQAYRALQIGCNLFVLTVCGILHRAPVLVVTLRV